MIEFEQTAVTDSRGSSLRTGVSRNAVFRQSPDLTPPRFRPLAEADWVLSGLKRIPERYAQAPCEACGTLVVTYARTRYRRTYCSEACRCELERRREEARNTRRRRRRVNHLCERCGQTFTPKRSDARYCSGACRQDAYRQRKAGRL